MDKVKHHTTINSASIRSSQIYSEFLNKHFLNKAVIKKLDMQPSKINNEICFLWKTTRRRKKKCRKINRGKKVNSSNV